MMARKPGSPSKALPPCACPQRGLWAVHGLEAEADDGAEPRYGGNHPDQVRRRDDIDRQPAGQRSHDERRRAPQSQRSIVQAVERHASQRIGIRQRHHRRPHAGSGGEGCENRERLMLGSDHRKPERGRKRRDDHGAAQRPAPFSEAGHQRQNREPRHRRNCRDDPDPRCVDPDRLQPHREKRQMGAGEAKHCAVKQRQPGCKSPGRRLRCDADL